MEVRQVNWLTLTNVTIFVVSRFSSKEEADKIMQIMKAEMEELRGNNRIRFLEGERTFNLFRPT
jgi:hypothetical protein